VYQFWLFVLYRIKVHIINLIIKTGELLGAKKLPLVSFVIMSGANLSYGINKEDPGAVQFKAVF
jgi:hypothetical protein